MNIGVDFYLQQQKRQHEQAVRHASTQIGRAQTLSDLARASYHKPHASSLIRHLLSGSSDYDLTQQVEARAQELISKRLQDISAAQSLDMEAVGRLRLDVGLLRGHAPIAVRNFDRSVQLLQKHFADRTSESPEGQEPSQPSHS